MEAAATIAFVLVTGFGSPQTGTSFIVVSSLYDESECHRVALELGAKNHKCIEYRLAVPQQIDAATTKRLFAENVLAIDDALSDLWQDKVAK